MIAKPSRKDIVNSLLVVASIFFALLIVETGYRALLYCFMPNQYKVIQKYIHVAREDISTEKYKPHPYLSYARTDTKYAENGMTINNRYYSFAKPKDKIRIACLGGSTTREKYPIALRLYLHSETETPMFEVMDFGCDGWTLQESLINYSIRVQDFSPDIIILHHGANDAMPRVWGEFKPDYTNFRTHWQDQTGLLLRWFSRYSFVTNGIIQKRGFMVHHLQNFVIRNIPKEERLPKPAPNSEQTYQRNLDSFIKLATKNNAHLILADMPFHKEKSPAKTRPMIQEHNEIMKNAARQTQTAYLNFAERFEDQQDWFSDAVHTTEEGKRYKARIAAAAVWNWYWDHADHLAFGHINPNEDEDKRKWRGEREITIAWNQLIPNATDYHVYVKERDETKYAYLGRSASGEQNELVWSTNAERIHPDFRSGPRMHQRYDFMVYALTPDGNVEITPDQSREIIPVFNRINYQ